MLKKSKIIKILIIFAVIAVCLRIYNVLRARKLFELYIESPIPKEVSAIRLKEKYVIFSSHSFLLKFKLYNSDLLNKISKGFTPYENFANAVKNFKSRTIDVTRDPQSKELIFNYIEEPETCGYAFSQKQKHLYWNKGQWLLTNWLVDKKKTTVPTDVYNRIYDDEYNRRERICKDNYYKNKFEKFVSSLLISKEDFQKLKADNSIFFYKRIPTDVDELLIFDAKNGEVYFAWRMIGR